MSAPSPGFEIPAELSEVFAKFIVTEYAYFTPKGEPLCWPVTPYWYPDRGVLAIATGLAYPNKAQYAKQNPKVSLLFSDPKSSGMQNVPTVLVRGDATVLDGDIQANTDRYVSEMRRKFPQAALALNSLTVRFLDFYLPRLWVEVTPVRIDWDGKSLGNAWPEAAPGSASSDGSGISPEELRSLTDVVRSYSEGVLATVGAGGYPHLERTSVQMSGSMIELQTAATDGPAALCLHQHSLGGTRFKAYMVRGTARQDKGRYFLEPQRLVGFFGNGAVFPLSVIPRVSSLRRRLHKELERRGEPMPQLRVPK